jgi:chitinase
MNKFAVAALATVASSHQLFLEMGSDGVPVAVDQVPKANLLTSNGPSKLYANGSKQKIIGYYTDWSIYARNFQPSDIPYEKIDYINMAFANIAGGKVVLGDSYADTDKAFPGDCWNPGCKRGIFN